MRMSRVSFVELAFAILIPAWSSAAEPTNIPELALKAMEYRVGKWESDGYIDGVKQAKPGHETTKWTPGHYAIVCVQDFEEGGKVMHGTGLIGWDAERRQLVEHWYTADGSTAAYYYTLDANKRAGVGTFKWVYPDGRFVEGKSVVQMKTDDEWEWNASYMEAGKERTWQTVNRRVKKAVN